MKIYTKQGDKGMTGIIGNKKLPKSHIKIQSYGEVDELNSVLGLLHHHLPDEFLSINKQHQNILFEIGTELASETPQNIINENDVDKLEKLIDYHSEKLEALQSFILPGGGEAASWAHYARTVTRRVERAIVLLNSEEKINPYILIWINRLSDYFFVLSRYLNHKGNVKDIEWKSRNK